jgi:3-hydroxyisobutyrate dehydrogenase-like beta-hydroxyacid dehydrogenase
MFGLPRGSFVEIETIGVIGLGATGRAVARRLLKQGRDVSVHDRDPWKAVEMVGEGARPARIPADAAEPADVVFVQVPTEKAVEEVLFDCGGVGETLREGGVVVISGRFSAAFLRSVADRLSAFRIDTVEAIMSSGVDRAPVSTLVGCDPQVLDIITPLLRPDADEVAHARPVGSVGMMRRLVTRLLALRPVVRLVPADCPATDDDIPRVVPGNVAPAMPRNR